MPETQTSIGRYRPSELVLETRPAAESRVHARLVDVDAVTGDGTAEPFEAPVFGPVDGHILWDSGGTRYGTV